MSNHRIYDVKSVGKSWYQMSINDIHFPSIGNPNLKFCPNCLRDVSEVPRNRSNRRSKKPLCPICNEKYKGLVDKEEIRDLRLKKLLRK
jgi:hypothetical protein